VSKTPPIVPDDSTLFEKIQQDRALLQSVFDRIPGMIYIHDLVNDVNLFRSSTLKTLLGIDETIEMASGRKIRSLIHQDDIGEFKQAAKQLQRVKDNECVRFTYRMRHINGKWLWFESEEYVYERDADGSPNKCLGYATDLTSTVEQQEELDRFNKYNEFLLGAAQILSQPNKKYQVALRELAKNVSLYFGVVCDISILNQETGVIRPEAIYHPNKEIRDIIQKLFDKRTVRKGGGLVGAVIETGKEILFNDVPEKMRVGPRSVDKRIVPISMLYVPLHATNGVLGSLNLTRLEGQEHFTDFQLKRIRRLGDYVSLFVENGILKERQKAEIELRQEAERQLAAAKLSLSKDEAAAGERYYNTILNNMGDPVCVKDDQSRLVLANDAFCVVFGRPRSEIIGRTLAEDVTPDEREHFLKVDKQVISDGKERIVEEQLTIGGGETRTISTRKTRFIDKTGNRFLVVVMREITERKRAEKSLRESEELFRKFIESSPAGLNVYLLKKDNSLVVVQSNPAVYKMTGIDADSILGKTLEEVFPGLVGTKVPDMYRAVARGEIEAQQYEEYYKDDRFEGWYEVSVFQLGLGLIGTESIEITDRKKAQAIIEKSNEQLESEVEERTLELTQLVADLSHSNTLLESSIESHPGLISLSLDTDYKYFYFNKAHEDIMLQTYGAKPKIGDCIFDYMTNAEDIAEVKNNYDKALNGNSHTEIFEYGSGDSRLHYETTFSPILRDEKVIGITALSQNITARIETKKTLKLSQERFESFSLNSGDAFFFHDLEHNILDVNQEATDMLGYSRDELLTMTANQIDPVWKGALYQKFLKVLDVNTPQTLETTVFRKDGVEVPVEVRFVKRLEDGQIYIQSLMRDRTEKKEQEERLRQSEERIRLVFENVEDIISVHDEEGIFESVNKTTQGNSEEDVIGTSLFDIYDEKKALDVRIKYGNLKKTGESFVLEQSYVGPDGSTVLYVAKFLAIFHDEKFFKAIVIVRDVTAERSKEQSVMNAVLQGQEQERKRLGAELHDGIGQVLSAIVLQVSQIREEVLEDDTESISSDLSSLNDNLQEAIREVRNISHDLMPGVLESFGLKEAVNQICINLHDRSGINVMFDHVDLDQRYSQQVEVNLYRVAQELLNNIQKHASCSKVFVSLMDHGESVSLTVEDDGVGFDIEASSSGIGLSNVISRITSISGQIDIESSENSGTLVNIDVPKTLE
jgi:PAS domain S-box-containing protein